MENDSARKIADEMARLVHLNARRVVEVGCGDGRISALLVREVGLLAAIDPEARAVRAAAGAVAGALFCVGSGEHLPLPDNCVDLAVFTLSLHHQNPAIALREAARVVGPGGEVVVVEPVIGGEVETVFSAVHDEDEAKRVAQRAIRESGLRRVSERFFGAEWRFTDIDDLYGMVFEYYDVPFDRTQADRVDELLGAKRDDRPLVLQDSMVIQRLAVG